MVRSNRHLHIEGYDELEDRIQVYKRIGHHKFKEEFKGTKEENEDFKCMLDEAIWMDIKENLKEKKVERYEAQEKFIHIYYTDKTENKVRNLEETKKNELIQELDSILVNQLKVKVADYVVRKERQKLNPYSTLHPLLQLPFQVVDKIIDVLSVSVIAAFFLIHPLSTMEEISEAVKKNKKEKNDIRLTKLYLANTEILEQPIQIVKNKECITTKVTPNNLEEFSYKSLKKAIRNNR